MIPAKYWSPTKKLMLLGAMAGGKAVEDTATGNPLTFLTDLSKPLKSLLIPFAPKQEGSGDPSPSNIRPIVPWDGLTVKHGGKNLLNPAYFAESSEFYSVDNGIITAKKSDYRAWGSLPKMFLRAGTYTISKSTADGVMVVRSSINDYSSSVVYAEGVASGKFTLSADAYIAIKPSENMSYPATFTLQLESGQTATAYEPYKPITDHAVSFPEPVYGGHIDLATGEIYETYAEYTFTGNEEFDRTHNTQGTAEDNGYFFRWAYDLQGFLFDNWNVGQQDIKVDRYAAYNNLSYWYSGIRKGDKSAWTVASYQGVVFRDDSYESASAFRQALTGTKMTYKHATPVYLGTLSPAQITALVGNNTLWSDANGQLTAVFFKKA